MTTIGPLERTITLADMVAYAGATWDWHRLHYDPAFLAERGLPAPVVDGQQLGALMAEQVLDALGPAAFITHLDLRYRSMMHAEETVRIEATILEDDAEVLVCTQRATVGDRVVAEGRTRIRKAGPDAR